MRVYVLFTYVYVCVHRRVLCTSTYGSSSGQRPLYLHDASRPLSLQILLKLQLSQTELVAVEEVVALPHS